MAHDAHGERCGSEVRYALFRWRDRWSRARWPGWVRRERCAPLEWP